MSVGDTLLLMKRRKCWRMICVGCLEEVEVPTVSSQEKVDMLESRGRLCTILSTVTSFESRVARRTRLSHGRHVHCTGLQFNTVHWDAVLSLFFSLIRWCMNTYKLATDIPEKWTNLCPPMSPPRSPF
jgi:hypothetical protein